MASVTSLTTWPLHWWGRDAVTRVYNVILMRRPGVTGLPCDVSVSPPCPNHHHCQGPVGGGVSPGTHVSRTLHWSDFYENIWYKNLECIETFRQKIFFLYLQSSEESFKFQTKSPNVSIVSCPFVEGRKGERWVWHMLRMLADEIVLIWSGLLC